jgi:16S rRNA (cytosine1402-N4)-methyltransferase
MACDQDAESLELARARLEPWKERVVFRQARFSQLESVVATFGKVDGLLADLGVSYFQLTHPERGFSIFADAPLEMTYDRSQETTAADVINRFSERELADLFRLVGERSRRKIARAIVRARPLRTTGQLARLVESVAPRTTHLHPATRVFLALRMEVNRELEELQALLEALPRLVNPAGRVVVLSFHSTEDRVVKRVLQDLGRQGRARILTKHVVTPGLKEKQENAPSRSARLRAIELS